VYVGRYDPEFHLSLPSEFTLPDIAKVSTGIKATTTILLDADRHLVPLLGRGWKGPGKLTVLVMVPEGQPGLLALTGPAKTLAKKTLMRVAGFHRKVRVFPLISPLAPRRGSLNWIADPVVLKSSVSQIRAMRERLDSHGDRYWLGVFGAITPRKNLPLIVEAILDHPEVGLLIAGTVNPEVSHAVAPLLSRFIANGGQVIRLEGPLTDAEFDSAIGAVDCVVAAHSNEASTGVVLRAAASGRRLVLAGAGYLRRDAGYLGEQATWSPLELDELRQAIQQARSLPAPQVKIELNADEFVRALTWA